MSVGRQTISPVGLHRRAPAPGRDPGGSLCSRPGFFLLGFVALLLGFTGLSTVPLLLVLSLLLLAPPFDGFETHLQLLAAGPGMAPCAKVRRGATRSLVSSPEPSACFGPKRRLSDRRIQNDLGGANDLGQRGFGQDRTHCAGDGNAHHQ